MKSAALHLNIMSSSVCPIINASVAVGVAIGDSRAHPVVYNLSRHAWKRECSSM